MARPVRGLDMDSDQRKELESLVRAPTTPQRSVQRARILLACADGLSQQEAARRVGVRRRIVTKWCGRFRKLGLAGLMDAVGRGRKPSLSIESRALIISWSNPGDTVLDPFGGSGTVGLMAVYFQRKAILIDKNPDYINLMKSSFAGELPLL